uniref:Phosphomannomutase/phosphoglucomutase n=1 Tax=Steinernema glaseri TaxID=37863 RepID=A0A1I8A9K0_9BILA
MERMTPNLPASIFRAYDIRGVVGEGLTAETAYWIGRAIGAQSLAQGEPHVSVGRDGRLSGPMLVEQLIKGLVEAGCKVSDVGLVPTPALYYAANALLIRLQTNDLTRGEGSVEKVEILDRYFTQITGDIKLAKKLKVVVDCGNGAAGVIAPQLIEALGCEMIPLFCEVDGNFPNHHPDP